MTDIYAPHFTNIWDNEVTGQQQFLTDLRLAYMTFVFRKEASMITKDYDW